MPTNEERREVSAGLRSCGVIDTGHRHYRYSFKGNICGCMLVGSSDTAVRAATAFLADLIEPDYTSEESGYFILPKPKKRVAHVVSYAADAHGIVLLHGNVKEWADALDSEIKRRLFETFVPERTCRIKSVKEIDDYDGITFGEAVFTCGHSAEFVYCLPNYCPSCGAKVVG